MPKKRVGVTLRKPSPAPEAATATAAALSVEPASTSSPETAAPAGPQSADAAGELHDVVMAPLSASAAEAFVNGAAAALEKAVSQLPMARLQALIARGREGYRELTLYLPEVLAQRLAVYCTEHNLDMSRLIATAVEQHLDELSGVQQRRAEDAALHEPRSPRQLVLELAAWVRALWATRAKWASRSASAPAAS
jgi:hypothetical protein